MAKHRSAPHGAPVRLRLRGQPSGEAVIQDRSGALPALAGITLFALLVRLVYLIQISRAPYVTLLMGDSKSYDAWARQIAAGDWMGKEVFYQAPLYPYFLGVIYTVIGHDLFAVRVAQSCLGALSCALVAHATWRLFSRRAGIVAGCVMAVYAPAVFFDGLIQKTALDASLTSLALWIVSGIITREGSWHPWVWLGLVMGALSLTRENALALVAVLGVWALWLPSAKAESDLDAARHATPAPVSRHARLLAFATGLAILLVPVAARNAAVGGGFYLTTSQFGPNLYLGNNPRTDGTAGSLLAGRGSAEYERRDATDLAERAMGRTLTPGEVSEYWTRQSLEFIRTQPGAWMRLMVRKVALLWNTAEVFDTESQESYAEWSPLLAAGSWVGNFGILVPLAVFGGIVSWRWRARLWILYLLIAAYATSVVVFFIYARYRFPLVPMLMVFAGIGLTDGVAFLRTRTRAQLASMAAVLTGVVVVTHWPLLDRRDMRAVTEHNIGAALQSEGQLDAAIERYRRAVAIKDTYVPSYSNMGAALLERGDAAGAIDAYTRALAIDPSFGDAHFNLGNAWLAQGNPGAAVPHFRSALAATPEAVDVLTNLGIALASSGQVMDGVARLEAAVRLAPNAVPPLRALGEVLADHDRHVEALATLQRAAELAPDDGEIRHALGRVLLALNRTDEAIRELRLAVARPPISPGAHNDLAIALASSGQLDEAERLLTQAMQTQPDNAEARRNLEAVRSQQRERRP